ncbi:hypothetical protein ACSG5Z_31610, partial [Bacillus sp. 'calajunan']
MYKNSSYLLLFFFIFLKRNKGSCLCSFFIAIYIGGIVMKPYKSVLIKLSGGALADQSGKSFN